MQIADVLDSTVIVLDNTDRECGRRYDVGWAVLEDALVSLFFFQANCYWVLVDATCVLLYETAYDLHATVASGRWPEQIRIRSLRLVSLVSFGSPNFAS